MSDIFACSPDTDRVSITRVQDTVQVQPHLHFLLSLRMLQSVLRHSAIVLTIIVNGMLQVHPVDISPIKAQSQLIVYGLWGFYRVII
jgi:hypothetical protein